MQCNQAGINTVFNYYNGFSRWHHFAAAKLLDPWNNFLNSSVYFGLLSSVFPCTFSSRREDTDSNSNVCVIYFLYWLCSVPLQRFCDSVIIITTCVV